MVIPGADGMLTETMAPAGTTATATQTVQRNFPKIATADLCVHHNVPTRTVAMTDVAEPVEAVKSLKHAVLMANV